MRTSVNWVRLSVVVVLVCLGALAIRVYQVHEQGWEFRLSPSAAPPRLIFEGRSYLRATQPDRLPAREVEHGHTPGGGVIFADKDLSLTPTLVWVTTGSSTYEYALQGGP